MSATGAVGAEGPERKGSPLTMARVLWSYRGFIAGMVGRDFRARYAQSLLGALWAVATPLFTLAIYAVVFSEVLSARLPGSTDRLGYALFLMAGLFPWTLFAETVTRCQSVFLDQGNLIKKAAFPRSALPAAAALSALVNFAVAAALFVAFLGLSGRWPGAALVAVLPLLLVQQALAVGLGVLVGTLQVFFRDAGHATGMALQFWFWLTPIVYPATILPEPVQKLFALNPLAPLFGAYQEVVLSGAWPQWGSLWPTLAVAAAALAAGYLTFRRLSGELVDLL